MSEQSVTDLFISLHPEIRERFPQIDRDSEGNPRVYLNNGGGTHMVDSAIDAMAVTAESANPLPGVTWPGEIATDRLQWETRKIIADFLHAENPEEINFHFSTTHALFNLAFALRSVMSAENNLVVTDLDHLANINPWEDVWGRERGCEIRHARVNEEGCLDVEHLLSLVDGRTGLVALTMASNGFGSLVPLDKITPLIREKSQNCLVCVDAVHHALHGPIDVKAAGCDFLALSGYKVFGPMLGVLWGRKELLERLEPYRVETNKSKPPWKMEVGALNNAVLASMAAALEYLLWLGDELAAELGKTLSTRKEKFSFVMDAVSQYDAMITRTVLEGFREMDPAKFKCYGITDPEASSRRDPTFAFDIEGIDPTDIKRLLWEKHGLQIADGNHYSCAVYRHLGRKSMCRASFAHYNTLDNARLFLKAVAELLA